MDRLSASRVAMPPPAARDVLELLKPVTWFPPIWAFLCGVVSSGVPLGDRWPFLVGGVLLTGPLVCGTSQAANDWFDRHVGRRLRQVPLVAHDTPRSVEQLTELVGRMSLKEIVRESTDLIERLCIEAALAYTSDNRASAAEVLGVSRQSLYSKLHRHGLGNLVSGDG